MEAGQWMLAAAAGRMMEATDYIHAKLHQYTSLLDDTVSRGLIIYYTVTTTLIASTSLFKMTLKRTRKKLFVFA